jgi:hypothetical protein
VNVPVLPVRGTIPEDEYAKLEAGSPNPELLEIERAVCRAL